MKARFTLAPRAGFALPLAILALVAMGALSVGGFYAATQEQRAGISTRHANEAFNAAQRGLEDFMGLATRIKLDSIGIDSVRTYNQVSTRSMGATSSYQVRVRRLATALYYVESTGTVGGGERWAAAHRVATLLRPRGLGNYFDQAIQVYDSLNIRGNVTISGINLDPLTWTDCPFHTNVTGIVAPDTSKLSYNGVAYTIVGTPPKAEEDTLTPPNFVEWGDVTYDSLANYASHVFPDGTILTGTGPVSSGSVCTTSVNTNWGSPENTASPCHTYFPIIHVKGDLKITGNSVGQGVLLVDGNLTFTGTVRYYGIVVVKGNMEQGNGNGQIIGSVMVQSGAEIGEGVMSVLAGNPNIQYSYCVIKRIEQFSDYLFRPVAVGKRAWVDVSGAGATMY